MGAVNRGTRNTFRNATRSVGIIVILSVAIALSISMLIGRSAVNQRISQVQAHTANTLLVSPPGSYGPYSNGSTLSSAQISKIDGLADVSSTTSTFTADLSSSDTSLSPSTPGANGGGNGGFGGGGFGGGRFDSVVVLGTQDPGDAVNNTALGGGSETLTKGSSFSATSTADEAILGSNIASTNDLTVGSTFTAWNTTIKVIGIYSAGTNAFANNDVLMPLATVQKLAGKVGDASSVTVYVTNSADLSTVQTEIQNALGSSNVNVLNSNQTVLSSLSTLSSTRSTMNYLLWGTIAAAIIILVLSMLMIVRERRREIGVLKAIGASNRSVITQFIAEASTFTVISAVVGFLLGLVLASPLTNQIYGGNTPSGPGGFPGRGRYGGGPGLGGVGRHAFGNALRNLDVSAGWSTLLFAFLIAVGVAVVGSSVAAATTLRIRPADVLRSE